MKRKAIYIFDEHVDYVKECKKMGMIPVEKNVQGLKSDFRDELIIVTESNISAEKIIFQTRNNGLYDGNSFIQEKYMIKQFYCDNGLYEVLGPNECYSGWEITVIEKSKMKFDELVSLLGTTKDYGEKVGSIGFLIKNFYSDFLRFLLDDKKIDKKVTKKIAKLIVDDMSRYSEHIMKMHELLSLCQKLKK